MKNKNCKPFGKENKFEGNQQLITKYINFGKNPELLKSNDMNT